jgi:pimeloyl-ACP methyl ester carboxylesterase
MSLVARSAEGMRALAGGNRLHQLGRLRTAGRYVKHLHAIAGREADEGEFIVGCHVNIGRHIACRRAPADALRGQIHGHPFIAVLHRHVSGGGFAVDPHMTGRFAAGNALDELERLGSLRQPLVNINVIQAIGRHDEPFHIGREAQMIRINNALDHALHSGCAWIEKGERIAACVGHDERFFIGREIQMMRLFSSRDAFDFSPSVRINHTHIRIQRIEHEDRRLRGCRGYWWSGWRGGGCSRLSPSRRDERQTSRAEHASQKLRTLQNKDFQLKTALDFTRRPRSKRLQCPANPLQNSAMTASVATKIEKIAVLGVNLEVMHIAAPSEHTDRAPIVFLHEGLGSVAMWRDFPQQLCQATGRAGLVYSRRGYGQSDSVPDVRGQGRLQPDYMHKEAAQVLPELLRLCGISKPILLGHSDGGTIALLHAAQFPVEACIVMAPHLFVEDISIKAITAARQAYETGDLRQRLAKFHANVDCAFWQWNDIWLSDAFRSFNIEAECKQITCPLLAIQGHDDPYGTMAQIDALGGIEHDFESQIASYPAKNLRRVLLKMEQCGHSPHRDRTKGVCSALMQFINESAMV